MAASYTPETSTMRAAMHSMIVALRSAALDAEIRGLHVQADAFADRADLGQAALDGPDQFQAYLNASANRERMAA